MGDLAQIMVSNKLSGQDVLEQADSLNLPTSVIQYLQVRTDRILVCDWLITSHMIQVTCSDWLVARFSRFLVLPPTSPSI